MPCFRFTGQGVSNDSWYEYYGCGNTASLVFNGRGLNLIVDGVNIAGAGYEYRNGTGQVSEVANSRVTSGYLSSGNCSGCVSPDKKYDCLNGKCFEHTVYNSPGLFATLVDCEAACGSNSEDKCQAPNICVSPDYCPPGMVCLTLGELSTIDGLSSELKLKNCS
jgi:hypothetical protein